MRRYLFFCLQLAALVTQTNAAEVRLEVLLDDAPHQVGQRGKIRVIVDNTDDPLTFQNGGLAISMTSSTPGVIEFIDATIYQPDFFGNVPKFWSAGGIVKLRAQGIDELLAISVGTAGFSTIYSCVSGDGACTQHMFADVEFEVLGSGSTDISIGPITSRPGHFIVQEGVDVSERLRFTGTTIDVRLVPEPTALGLLFAGFVGAALRRPH